MRAVAVIGAGFGDEGKGRVVDYLAAQDPSRTLVIRHNGGAQAGHTVVTPNGVRHVFHHFGSGSLAGAATFLSRFFVVNPLLWQKEFTALRALGFEPEVTLDLDSPLTTPYDMLVNQEAERLRTARHGSCGYGINETVERFGDLLGTSVADALDLLSRNRSAFRDKLNEIRTRWAPERLAALVPGFMERVGADPLLDKFLELLASDALLESYLSACQNMLSRCRATRHLPVDENTQLLLFEGAQGLLLDEQHRFFPHVTRSRPGSWNVRTLLHEACLGATEVETVYVTRPYMTRHGAGPFPSEDPALRYEDETNAENPWQGPLRFGALDVELLAEGIKQDGVLPGSRHLAVTCFDQVSAPRDDLGALSDATELPFCLVTLGPKRDQTARAEKALSV